jgi:hypothetical protein
LAAHYFLNKVLTFATPLSGYIPPVRSAVGLIWVWIASFCLSVPIIVSGDGSLVDVTTW